MSTTNKTTLKYRVVQTYNPSTKTKDALRPVLVDVATVSLGAVVDFALENGYMRGQTEVEKGNAQGFLEAIKVLAGMGYSVNINDWFRVRGYLTGTVGETGSLTSDNEYKVRLIALQELKQDKSLFSFTKEGDSAKCSIQNVCYPGATEPNVLRYGDDFVASGSNLYFNAEDGDTCVLTKADGTTTLNIACSSWSYNALNLAWNEGILETDVGTEMTLTFTLHGGNKDAAPKVITKKVKLLAAE